ncbi:putative histidine kinase g7 protein [Phaeoacremonium minimum UCRPA7]|uniref:Putative histidine kinase g7 protein n=1 Tax=Phaeoacremonium minimum (strain UCR-PA7) TaxID=1286976 RepID=R8BG48_PHAM7|nr:putative histidine kinase g7 protein [Phaeoacremonium minimum UCRPA7]EON98273.1 putative histidine kinase g7 protein [Phaeoacremonium minimum UCRPA7]
MTTAKSVSETARERETFKYDRLEATSAALNDPQRPIPTTLLSSAPDSALTAFAQLGAFRLNASRALISLFDRHRQHIVAEAACSSPLRPKTAPKNNELWLCGTSIPRSFGICEHVLTSAPTLPTPWEESSENKFDQLPVSVVPDLGHDGRFCDRPFIEDKPYNRFYAGVPIRSPTGINIGVYCIFDDKPRDGLTEEEKEFLQAMSRTVMDYLELKRSNELHRRTERMVCGMGNFVEGEATLSSWHLNPNPSSFMDIPGVKEGALNRKQQTVRRDSEPDVLQQIKRPILQHRTATAESVLSLTDPKLTPGMPSRDGTQVSRVSSTDMRMAEVGLVFSKAANIIRQSLEVEGTVFLDATVRSFGGLVGNARPKRSPPVLGRAALQDSSPEEGSHASLSDLEEEPCKVLGFSTSQTSSINGDAPHDFGELSDTMFHRLLRRYPHGKIFNFEDDGAATSDDNTENDAESTVSKPTQTPTLAKWDASKHIIKMFPGARSVALVPLWDSTRNRWYGGGFIWTKTPTRNFTVEGELGFLRVFALTTMAEVTRLNTTAADKVKTSILGSLSHEMRSPLHGLVGAAELLRDTDLDTAQTSVLHTIETSGRTLLDTIEHLLDYSKINHYLQSSTTAERRNSTSWQRRPLAENGSLQVLPRSENVAVRLDLLVGEVVESVLAGYSHERMTVKSFHKQSAAQSDNGMERRGDSIGSGISARQDSQFGEGASNTGAVQIYLDIDPSAGWVFLTHPGAFRRIVMNLFGNSLKFTSSGFIKIALAQEAISRRQPGMGSKVVLTVSDTGKGIGEEYLRNNLFTPFCQEDHFAPGTGLGLSLVRQITTTLGGSINVASQVGCGTTITVSFPLPRGEQDTNDAGQFEKEVKSFSGVRVGLHGFSATRNTANDVQLDENVNSSQTDLMRNICHDLLHLEVSSDSDAQHDVPDCIIHGDASTSVAELESLAMVASKPVIAVCPTPTIAHKMAKIAKKMDSHATLEFIIEPRKLATTLSRCLTRHDEALKKAAELPLSASASAAEDLNPEPVIEIQPLIGNEPKVVTVVSAAHLPAQMTTEVPIRAVPVAIAPEVTIVKPAETLPGILLVDDNLINLKILTAYMKKLKLPYSTAVHGLEALEKYSACPSHYSCVVTDISMPVMDGLEATRRIREFERASQIRPVPVIALTGLVGRDIEQDSFASGVNVFLTRPVTVKKLMDALKSLGLG